MSKSMKGENLIRIGVLTENLEAATGRVGSLERAKLEFEQASQDMRALRSIGTTRLHPETFKRIAYCRLNAGKVYAAFKGKARRSKTSADSDPALP